MDYKFKQPEKVVFTEKGHTYTKGEEKYISVTTLLEKYHEEFKEDYWSTYKAVKDVLEEHSDWPAYKRKAGGWKNVVDYFKDDRLKMVPAYQKLIAERKQYYIDLWEAERVYASDLGNKAHNDLEGDMLNAKYVKMGSGNIGEVTASDILDLQGFDNDRIFTELLLWNEQYKLAGQADVVEKEGMKVHIKDYKTVKVIEFEPFMDARFYSPLEELTDTNYNKFTMQLSTYGWMLEQLGYEVVGCTMIHLHRETGAHIKDYPLAYRPDLVEKMLQHYKQLS